MTTMEKVRRRFLLLLGILFALDAGLVAYLVWPGSNSAALKQEEAQLREEVKLKRQQAAPLKDIDSRLQETRENIKKFYAAKIPTHWSQISSELSKLAQENKVALSGIQYKTDDTGLSNVKQIGIETGVVGDYGNIARFLNAVERDKLLFVINQINVRAAQQAGTAPQGGTVELQINFETFLQEV